MNKNLLRLACALIVSHLLTACDSPSGLVARRTEQSLIRVRANVVPGASPQSAATVQIADPGQLPAALRNARQIRVIFDASDSTTTVTRNADGSLSFPLLTGRSFGSGSSLNLLMVGDGVSYTVQLLTGSPLQLGSPAFTVSPANTVALGTKLELRANLAAGTDAAAYSFNWEVAPGPQGPWQALAGSGTSAEFEPRQAGSYYVRLGITETRSRSVSSYLSPSPVVYVTSADRISETTPASGSIVAGEQITLKATVPGLENVPDLLWAYAVTAQGPFLPIAARGSEIRWEPPAAGSYFLRIDAGRLGTYTSSRAEVLVSTPDEVIVTDPVSGSVVRGQRVTLATTLPPQNERVSYSWFYAFSPAGPFTPLAESGRSVSWTPPLTGEFFIRLRTYDPDTDQSRTYTSTSAEVSVRDSNEVFSLSPNPASLRRGDSVSVSLVDAPGSQVNWSYASSLQGAFVAIPETGPRIDWTPTEAGSFYLRATATRPDGTVASFTSADPLVFVAERTDVIQTLPGNGQLELGQPVTLRADFGVSRSDLRYLWSYSSTATGPFLPVQALESGPVQSVTWYPPAAGSFFVRVEVTNPASQSTVSFVSQEPIVRVSETRPFFSTDPANGRTEPDKAIRLRAAFETGGRNFNFGWAYSRSTAGPFTPIGGSSGPEILWDDENKPVGSYYIRLQATSPGSDRTQTFLSAYPIVFVDVDDSSSGEFGSPESGGTTGGFPF